MESAACREREEMRMAAIKGIGRVLGRRVNSETRLRFTRRLAGMLFEESSPRVSEAIFDFMRPYAARSLSDLGKYCERVLRQFGRPVSDKMPSGESL